MSASLHRGHPHTSEIELPSRRTRRRHAPGFSEQVAQACRQPGVSIAAVAWANGLDANRVRKWVIDAEARPVRVNTGWRQANAEPATVLPAVGTSCTCGVNACR